MFFLKEGVFSSVGSEIAAEQDQTGAHSLSVHCSGGVRHSLSPLAGISVLARYSITTCL